jgi:hypothetical protein
MARKTGIYRRRDSRFWWIDVVLPSGKHVCLSARTEIRAEAEALLARLKADSFREAALGGWKSRVMVDRYAKFATEHLAVAAARIEGKRGENVIDFPTNSLRSTSARDEALR